MKKIHSYRCVEFILNGRFWTYFVSSHNNKIPVQKIFLTEQGELPITWDRGRSIEFFRKQAIDYAKAGLLPL
jgi:hypothetical protein